MIDVPEKPFYKIGEVCQYTDTQPYVLRFWESEFPQLAPEKNRNGQRVYRKQDIDLIFRIKKLLYEEEYTIAGARRKLEHADGPPPSPTESDTVVGEIGVEEAPRGPDAPVRERRRWFDDDEVPAPASKAPAEGEASLATSEAAEARREAEHFRKLHLEAKHELDRVASLYAETLAENERLHDEVRSLRKNAGAGDDLRAENEQLRVALDAAESVRAALRTRHERLAARLDEIAESLEGAP